MLTLSIVTPAKKIVADIKVDDLFVPANRGELNILPGHASLMSTLATGVLRYKPAGATSFEQVAISWGYLEVTKDNVVVLAETAEAATEIDLERAKLARDKAEKALFSADLDHSQFKKYQLKLERAMIRLQVASRPGASDTEH